MQSIYDLWAAQAGKPRTQEVNMQTKALLAAVLAVPLLLQLAGPVSSADHDKMLIAKKHKQQQQEESAGAWQHDLQAGLAMAREQKKMVFVDIGAPW